MHGSPDPSLRQSLVIGSSKGCLFLMTLNEHFHMVTTNKEWRCGACDPALEAEAGGSGVLGQPGVYKETLSKRKKEGGEGGRKEGRKNKTNQNRGLCG